MNNASKHVRACRAETAAEKLIRLEWLAGECRKDEEITSAVQDHQSKPNQT